MTTRKAARSGHGSRFVPRIGLNLTDSERLLCQHLPPLRQARPRSKVKLIPGESIELSLYQIARLANSVAAESRQTADHRVAQCLQQLYDKILQTLEGSISAWESGETAARPAPRRRCAVANKRPGIAGIPAVCRLFQLRIELIDVCPAIWRRIQIHDCTLDELHGHIQLAMGWQNRHLYQFRIRGLRYSNPCWELNELDHEIRDATRVRLSDVVPQDGRRFRFGYTYDFGDDWQHDILFEGCLPSSRNVDYPLCLEGERACPPEEIGGIWGFEEYLEAIVDPSHDRHDVMVLWNGPFDPDRFDSEAITRKMRRGPLNWEE